MRLAGSIFAPHYARALPHVVVSPAPLWAEPSMDGHPLSEIVAGETFDVLEQTAGRAWGCAQDGSVGFIDAAAIALQPDGAVQTPTASTGDPVERARAMIGTPYRTGGRTPAAVDADGFIYAVHVGIAPTIARFADLQQEQGLPVDLSSLRLGDALFCSGKTAMLIAPDQVAAVDPDAGVVAQALNAWLAAHPGAIGRRFY
ncbi:hypothetical protein ACPVPU_09315 [Sphingomonas sp. CJ99]